MSLAAVNTATPSNVNHPANQTPRRVPNQHQQPSVQNARGPQTPTDAARSNQDTGNHIQVQQEQAQNTLANPLTSAKQSLHNQNVARGGF